MGPPDPLFFIARGAGQRETGHLSELDEARLVTESGQEARVAHIIEPVLAGLGYRLVRVRLSRMNGLTLQVMAERPHGTMGIEECEEVSKAISPVLDIEDPIKSAYNLEVSSPGIDRPLVRASDFVTWAGHVARVETRSLIGGRKRFKGRIASSAGGTLVLERDDAGPGEDAKYAVPLAEIADAKLTLSEDLIREALRRDKALRKGGAAEDAEGNEEQED